MAEAAKDAPEEEVKEEVKSAPESKPSPAPASTPAPAKTSTTVAAPVVAVAPRANGKVKASPLAKRLAEERSINLAMVKGSGEGGRIVKRDVDTYQGGGTFSGVERYTDEPVSQMRKAIARSLGDSKFSAPHFYLTISLDMDAAVEARKSINKLIAPAKISFNDIVVKAASKALLKHPAVNSSWMGETIRRNEHVHMGVAVAVDEGLLVPVVRFADGKTLTQIGAEVKEYAGVLKPKTSTRRLGRKYVYHFESRNVWNRRVHGNH